MDANLAIFRIAIIATIVVSGNCDNCCHQDSYLFFPQLPQLQQLLSSGVNCIFFQNCHNCDNCDGKGSIDVTSIFQNCHNCDNCGHRDSYISELHESLLLCQRDAILAISRIAIIATIVVTGIHLCFFHNCNNCCHQESELPYLQQLWWKGIHIFFLSSKLP